MAEQQIIEIDKDSKLDSSWFSDNFLTQPQLLSTKVELQDNLLVSSMGMSGGGLLALAKGADPIVRFVDRLISSGMWMSHHTFVRSVYAHHMVLHVHWENWVQTIISESYKQVHDVRMQFDQLHVVSTGTNEVVQLASSGKLLYRWKFPGEGDVWHLNCLDLWNGRYVVSCFGRFERVRQFKDEGDRAGMIIDLETEKVLWDGLTYPHHPRMDSQGREYVCDSGTHKLLRRDADGSNQREIFFPGAFTRGMAFGQDCIYVGLSCMRSNRERNEREGGIPTARIAVVNMETFENVGEIDVPCSQIYDIVVAPDDAVIR